jgi:Holliday junction resolvase RusA-like endonuclease
MTEIVIVLPLPDKHLSPNCPGGTRWKSSYVKRAREAALEEAQVAINDQLVPVERLPLRRATSQETYYWPTKRRRDVRNAEASMKSYYDGIVKAGVLKDDDIDHLTHLPSTFAFDKDNPRVEIIIREVVL